MKRDSAEEDKAGGAGTGWPVNAVADRFTIPRQPEGLIRRPRLTELLERGVAGPLTLVSSPAGTGKTVLVSVWARRAQTRGPVAWVTLDAGDESLATFWSSFCQGLVSSWHCPQIWASRPRLAPPMWTRWYRLSRTGRGGTSRNRW